MTLLSQSQQSGSLKDWSESERGAKTPGGWEKAFSRQDSPVSFSRPMQGPVSPSRSGTRPASSIMDHLMQLITGYLRGA